MCGPDATMGTMGYGGKVLRCSRKHRCHKLCHVARAMGGGQVMAYARWTEKEVESVMDMLDEGLTPLQVARQFPGRSVISVRSKCYDSFHP